MYSSDKPQRLATKKTTAFASQARALVLSVAILGLALAILWLGNSLKDAPGDTLIVREVTLAAPPPPPPPALEQPVVDTPITLQVQGAGPALQVLNIQQQEIKIQKPDAPSLQSEQPQWEALEVNWDAFSLDDLDNMPTLLTPLRITLPKSITRQGITEVMVAADIIVHENGRVELIQVTQNPYPELKPEIDKLIRSSRFTPPKKGDDNVRVKFNWPIRIRS